MTTPPVDRRAFLQWGGTGLSGIAPAALLHEQRLLAGEPPIRPLIDPAQPFAPRAPHFAPKAKNVLMIFCSGALSHVDTFDYKPELIRLHDTPMPTPGGEKLITFQGEQGNLIKPLWEFKPRGESGTMTSDLLPRLGELARNPPTSRPATSCGCSMTITSRGIPATPTSPPGSAPTRWARAWAIGTATRRS